MKKVSTLLLLFAFISSTKAQIYLAKDCEISFYSASPLENIEAVNKAAKPILNTTTGDIQVRIVMRGFQFEKALMQEHFNENYVESEKYPDAIFKGKINEKIDYTTDSVIKVTVTGILNMHGVEKEKTIAGTLNVKGKQILIAGKFTIHLADHNIKIPNVVVKNIAEDVEVKINALLEPFKKQLK